jgi:hypothetical protein
MENEALRISVLTWDPDWLDVVRTASQRLPEHPLVVPVEPNDPNIKSELKQTDLLLADVDLLPLSSISRRQLYEILANTPALFLYLPTEDLTYERTREAFLSGARDLVPRPASPDETVARIIEYLPAIAAHAR